MNALWLKRWLSGLLSFAYNDGVGQFPSRTVRRLRIILPIIALIAVGALWATARVIPGDLASLVAMSGIDVKSNSVP